MRSQGNHHVQRGSFFGKLALDFLKDHSERAAPRGVRNNQHKPFPFKITGGATCLNDFGNLLLGEVSVYGGFLHGFLVLGWPDESNDRIHPALIRVDQWWIGRDHRGGGQDELRIEAVTGRFVDFLPREVADEPIFVIVI